MSRWWRGKRRGASVIEFVSESKKAGAKRAKAVTNDAAARVNIDMHDIRATARTHHECHLSRTKKKTNKTGGAGIVSNFNLPTRILWKKFHRSSISSLLVINIIRHFFFFMNFIQWRNVCLCSKYYYLQNVQILSEMDKLTSLTIVFRMHSKFLFY